MADKKPKKYVVVSWVEGKDKVLFTLSTKTEAIKKLDDFWLGVEIDGKKANVVGRDLAIFTLPKSFKNNDEFRVFLKENQKVMKKLVEAFKEFFKLRKNCGGYEPKTK